ncbi:sugar phosphate isomerase [Oscillospiraceae bacterium]|nr:sugar phosphate isomerase [Oscillospiraceae bacterium]
MKIGVIQASSQKEKNRLLYECTKKAVQGKGHEVINFGVQAGDGAEYSYVQAALLICLLLESKAVDFVVTGCSSGQGMMLACNSLPGVLCGYAPTPADAYLFGRINGGNALSVPLGLNFGWAGEINLQYTLNALFEEPFGMGYPPQDAGRKQTDTRLLKSINRAAKRELADALARLDPGFVESCLQWERVRDFILQHGRRSGLAEWLGGCG